MVIQHNISSLNAWRNTKLNTNSVSKNLEKLSSGFRINRAADDAAGLAISEKMRGQIRGTMMGTQNVNMGINLVQTAEGGLNENHAILQRMRELAVQSANGTYSDEDRAQIDKEYQALKSEIDRIANTTNYNGIPLLNVRPYEFAVGPPTPANPANFLTQLTSLSTNPPPVNPDGSLNLNVTNVSGTSGSILIYGQGGTSHNKLQLSGGDISVTLDVRSGMTLTGTNYFNDTDPGGERWETTYTYQQNGYDIELKQILTVENPTSQSEFYHIEYEIANKDGANNISASFLFNIDTQFTGAGGTLHDDPRFSLNGTANQITNGTIFSGGNIPSTVDLWHETNRNLNARIIVTGSDIYEQPDTLFIGGWPITQNFNYTGGEYIGHDSEYSVVWKDKTIAAGATLTLNTMYGVTDPMLNPDLAMIPGDPVLKSTALWIQSGANVGDGMYIKLCDSRSPALGIDNTAVNPQEKANEAIKLIDDAINIVSSYRADFGASQNRLESTLRNNGVKTENLQAAESTIRDVDMAKEMMEFTKNNILIQAAQSMLAQANQLPQGVLSLLR